MSGISSVLSKRATCWRKQTVPAAEEAATGAETMGVAEIAELAGTTELGLEPGRPGSPRLIELVGRMGMEAGPKG